MNFTPRQISLLSIALTMFYDQVCKDGTTQQMKDEILELSDLIVKSK